MIPRRTLGAAVAALALGMAAPALAQSYPSRVIKLVVPFTPGSPNDVMARLLTQHLAPRLGQPIVIENKPGGGTTIGTKAAAMRRARRLYAVVHQLVDRDRSGDEQEGRLRPAQGLRPGRHREHDLLGAGAFRRPCRSRRWPEFVAHTKSHPGTVNFAATQGTAAMLVAELFKQLSGADLSIIPYKGGAAALPDFLGGRIQVLNPTPSTSIPLIRDGKMRALAITSPGPHRPAAGRADRARGRAAGPDAGILGRRAGAGRHAAGDRRQAQRGDQRDACSSPEMKEGMAKLGIDAKIGSPQDFARFIAEETPRWTDIVKSTGVKFDVMAAREKIIIIGGGIGGLAAALSLLKRGLDVEVHEQAPELKEVGAGIQISSNGTRVLYALGLEEALKRVQVLPSGRVIRHWSTGETWNWFDLGAASGAALRHAARHAAPGRPARRCSPTRCAREA